MSIFDSINICEPQPKMISLQEESPEIHSDTKTKHPLSKKNKHFSLSKTDSQKSEQADLKLSYEIAKEKKLSNEPINKERNIEEEAKNNLKKFIIETFKNDDDLTLKEKLAFSLLLVMNTQNFDEQMIKELNEEECHLSLLNWVWRYNKKIKQFQVLHQLKINLLENFEIFLPQYNKLLIEINFIMELLINILNLFVFLPINSSDILHLKLYEKLFKIKEYIKVYTNDYLLNLINYVLNKWKTVVDTENETKIMTRYKLSQLGMKHSRPTDDKEDKEDTEADSVDENEINNIKIYNINNNPNIFSNLNKKTKNKNNIKVSFDLQKNSVIYFKKDDIPLQISLDKQIQDSSNLP